MTTTTVRPRGFGYLRLLLCSGNTALDYVLLVTGLLAAVGAGVPFPILGVLFGELVDKLNSATCASQNVNPQEVQASVNQKVLLIIYITVANFLAIYLHAGCWSLFGERLVGRLRQRYFQAILRQEMAFFDSLSPGETSARLSHDVETVRAGTSEKVGIFISSFSYFIGAYLVAFIKVAKLAGMLAFLIPAYLLMVIVGGAYVNRYTKRTSDRVAAASSIVSQCLSNVALIQALGAGSRLEIKLAQILGKAQKEGLKRALVAAVQFGSLFFIAYSANALAFWQGSKDIAGTAEGTANGVTAGAIYTVIFLLVDASLVVSQVAPILQVFGSATATARILQTVIDRPSLIDGTIRTQHQAIVHEIEGSLEFREVSFEYPSRPNVTTLDEVTVRFPHGKHTAIVGASGSGKSTITSLLTRLYDPSSGSVLIDGIDIREINVRCLRSCIGLVDQEPFLLNRSILENIALGLANSEHEDVLLDSSLPNLVSAVHGGENIEAAIERQSLHVRDVIGKVRQAASLADADQFIDNMEHGYASLVGIKGGALSGGQRQRIALARALIKNPKILLLDEATASLDSASEQCIQLALKEVLKGRTTVTVAHRLSTIKDADNIIVLSNGKVVEQGSHSQLLERNGAYAAMITSQKVQSSSLRDPESIETSPSSSLAVSNITKSDAMATQPIAKRSVIKSQPFKDHTTGTALKQLLALALSQRWFIILGFVACIMAGGSYTGEAVIFGHTLGHFDPCQGAAKIRSTGNLAGLLFFVIGLVAFSANVVGGSSFGRVSEKLIYNVRLLVFRSLLDQEVLWHNSNGRTPAMLLQYFTRDASALAGLSGTTVGTLVTILVNLVASIILTHVIAWKIAIVLLATLPVLLGSGIMRLKALAKFHNRHQAVYATSIGLTVEAVESVKVVVSLSLEPYFLEAYKRSLAGPYKASFLEIAYTNFWLATAFSVSNLIYALAYWWGSQRVAAGEYTQTEFFIVLPALLFSAQSCGQMFALAPDLSGAQAAATRLVLLFKMGPSTLTLPTPDRKGLDYADEKGQPQLQMIKPYASDSSAPTALSGTALQVHDVYFHYPNRPARALSGLSIDIAPGEFCALVGPSGVGKSTIISLLEGFYMPSSGQILVNGRDINGTGGTGFRSDVALVPQDNVLFDGSIRFNIGLGARPDRDATDEEIERACQLASIHDTISALPHGYDTQCGTTVDQFSGGQRQRMCIARALVRQPRLLLLDEPTSALDAESETHFQNTLSSIRGKMTIIAVAHRLHTIQRADKIFLIEDGRCVDQGTHVDLLQRSQSYRENAAHQALDA